MTYFVDLTSQLSSPTAFTGSVFSTSNNVQAASPAVSPLVMGASMQTGSWPGLGNTWGASNSLTGSLSSSLAPGHWWGIDYSWGTYLIPTESIDRFDTTSNMFSEVNQGVAQGYWDPFPIPVAPPAPILPPRDLTRYKKSYSFSRHQPVRIRLVRP